MEKSNTRNNTRPPPGAPHAARLSAAWQALRFSALKTGFCAQPM
jgi:hypothetical protein